MTSIASPIKDRPRVIVVGVDGSACSVDALRWAAGQAELSGAALRVVMGWNLPETYGYTPRDFEGAARKALDEAIERALGPHPESH